MPIDPFFGGALGAAANIGGALISSGAQAAMNQQNIAAQNMWNQQTLNAQMAAHQQNTAFMEDQQSFNREERQYAENFNATQAALGRNFSAEQAEKFFNLNAQFQQHMSNTAYQRAMADMKAAGLNPILAYQQGGAGGGSNPGSSGSSPTASVTGASSGMASTGSVTPHYAARGEADLNIGRAMGNIVTSAADTMKAIAAFDSMRQSQRESEARTDKVKEETQTEPVRRTQIAMETLRTSHDIENVKANFRYILAQTDATLAAAGLTNEQIKNLREVGSKELPNSLERLGRMLQDAIESGVRSYGGNPRAPAPAVDAVKGTGSGAGIGGFFGRMFK